MKLGDTIFNGNQFKKVILNSVSYNRLILGVNLVWSYFSIAIKSFRTRILADGGTYEGESILEDKLQEITPNLFDSASLVITPNGVKTSKLYSIKPNDGTGDLSVTRATTATRIDENGNIVNVPANVARIDYSNGSPAILVEPQRTNLVPNSKNFNGWILTNSGGVIISSVNTSNPFGFESVSKIIPTNTLGQHRPFVSVNLSEYGVFWVIAKADGYNYLSLAEGGGTSGSTIIFNLSNGTISGTADGYTPQIYPLGNGWYKCLINMRSVGTLSRFIIVRNNNTTADYSGDGTSGILIAHSQLEVGSFGTSAIITSGTIATRNADVISNTNASTLIGQLEGTIFLEFIPKVLNSDIARICDKNSPYSDGFFIFISPGGNLQCIIRASGSTVVNSTIAVNISNTPVYKVVLKYSSGNIKIFVNGFLRSTHTATYTFSSLLNGVFLDNAQWTSSNQTRGINTLALWKPQITDTQAIQLTTL